MKKKEKSRIIAPEKGIRKTVGRPLASFSVMWCYVNIPFRPRSVRAFLAYIRTVIHDFFALQFLAKYQVGGIKKIPVVRVDHPLDQTIPFLPHKIKIYMHFVNFWIEPMSMLIRRYGAHNAMPFCSEWLRVITKAYEEAARMYRFRMSTMARPAYYKGQFLTIHLFDPHLLCVPSLHIAIVVLCSSFYRHFFEREQFSEAEKQQWNAELYAGAVAIAESVLYVKQHSVNCVPAALYMVSHLFPDLFTPTDAVAFIGELFQQPEGMSDECAQAVRTHILDMYERLLLEGAHDDDWRTPVQRWIVAYERENPLEAQQDNPHETRIFLD